MPAVSGQTQERSKGREKPSDHPQSQAGGEKQPEQAGPSMWEWVVGVVGLILVLGAIGFLVYQAVSSSGRPPDIVIEVSRIERVSTGYLVELVVRNRGDQTASGVDVEGTLERDGSVVESSRIRFPYVPASSTRKGGLYFTRDPSSFTFTARPVGYQNP